MRYIFYYLYHYFISNSRHGTHSPFVYAMADQVIYNKKLETPKQIKIPHNLKVSKETLIKKILFFLELKGLSADIKEDQYAYWIGKNHNEDSETLLKAVENGKILIVDHPYNIKQQKLWKSLIKDDRVVVSINLFHFGIVLHRKGQYKQNFLLVFSS